MERTISWQSLKEDPSISRLKELTSHVLALAHEANLDFSLFPDLADTDWITRVLNRTSAMFTIMVIGQVSSGKSSFLNSLFGRKLLLPSDQPTDGVVSVLMQAPADEPEYAEKVLKNGKIEKFATIREALKFLRQQETSPEEQLQCREVRLYLHEPWLNQLRIVNTPGLGDRLQEFERVALQYLHENESDLIVWTFFPDTAANSKEVGVFHGPLARRRENVVGIVTRCLEGKEDDEGYNPYDDPSFVGINGVVTWLQQNLGEYLQEIILYDSHEARRLVEKMRKDPNLQTDKRFVAKLERCGYGKFRRFLNQCLGEGRERLQEARALSLLRKCAGYADGLASAAREAAQVFLDRADANAQEIEAWNLLEREIIGPFLQNLKNEVRELAHERSKELITIMSTSCAYAINENFKLHSSLGRSLLSWTGLCDSAADQLNNKTNEAIKDKIERDKFFERLNEALELLLKGQFLILKKEIDVLERPEFIIERFNIDSHCVPNTNEVIFETVLVALRAAIAEVSRKLSEILAEKASEKTVEETTKKAAEKIIQKGAEKAAQETAKETTKRAGEKAIQVAGEKTVQITGLKITAATVAKIASVISWVLVPFDIAKMFEDFQKNRSRLVEYIQALYEAERPSYELRLFDTLWPAVWEAFYAVLNQARAESAAQKENQAKFLGLAQRAKNLSKELTDIAQRMRERADGRA